MRTDALLNKQRRLLNSAPIPSVAGAHSATASAAGMPIRRERAQPRESTAVVAQVRWAQAALSAVLGLRLPIDGVLDATTQMALRRFQESKQLATTGQPDRETLAALAQALGHSIPGAPEHRGMPAWFLWGATSASAAPPPAPRKPSPTASAAHDSTAADAPQSSAPLTSAHKELA